MFRDFFPQTKNNNVNVVISREERLGGQLQFIVPLENKCHLHRLLPTWGIREKKKLSIYESENRLFLDFSQSMSGFKI